MAVEVFCEAITEEFFDSIIVKFLELNPDLDQESLISDLNNELKLKISIDEDMVSPNALELFTRT